MALTAAYIREHILFLRQWDPEYAAYALERVKKSVPWLMKEAEPRIQPASDNAEGERS